MNFDEDWRKPLSMLCSWNSRGCEATAADFALAAWIHTNLTQRSAAFGCIWVCPDMSNVQGRHAGFFLNHLSGHRNSSRETSENGRLDRTTQDRWTPKNAGTNLHPYGTVGFDPQLRSIIQHGQAKWLYLFCNMFLLHSSAMIIYNY